jgi:hypothetical protein
MKNISKGKKPNRRFDYLSIYLNRSFISADTGKSRYIFGSYAVVSGVLYSFCPPVFNICDEGESDCESPCVSSLSSPYD